MTGLPVGVGDVVFIPAYHRGYRPEAITLRLTRIRDDLPSCYDGAWIWVEGHRIEDDGREGPWVQVFARVAALVPRQPPAS
ncbi:MAG: hypothetical protein JXA67_11065 [Micromonosporaceae bacterium]|nr:hypothetical protein [Micromonosporaceae bacterium]